jgi:hypothetical protein
MKTTTVIDHFGIKANSISSDCAFHSNMERYLISSVGLELSYRRRGTGKLGSPRLLDLLSLTT